MIAKPGPYLLSHLSTKQEERERLNTQHHSLKHAALDGQLIHPTIPLSRLTAIADLGCGSGVWLDDISSTHFTSGTKPELVGFDLTPHHFDVSSESGAKLIEHDCTLPFDEAYHGKFDMVNIRLLAHAVPAEGFSHIIRSAIQLLKPGGYFQWLESDFSLFKTFPYSPEVMEVWDLISALREKRGLVPYLPDFMIREMLSFGRSASILHFNLLPSGYAREGRQDDVAANETQSTILLEGIPLVLSGAITAADNEEEKKHIHKLLSSYMEIWKMGKVKVGAILPQLIAQKST